MLIECQSQKKSSEAMDLDSIPEKGITEIDDGMDQQSVKVKTEINDDSVDVEMTDLTGELKKVDQTNAVHRKTIPVSYFEKGINIDPRTYCKLGHYHLLLENYEKGKTIF